MNLSNHFPPTVGAMPTAHRFIDPDSLAGRVIRERQRLGLLQEELAKRASVNQGTLSLIESGETRNPSSRVLVNLAIALGVTARYLMNGTPGDLDETRAAVEICSALSPASRAAWLAIGRALLGDGDHGDGDKPKPAPLNPRSPSNPRKH